MSNSTQAGGAPTGVTPLNIPRPEFIAIMAGLMALNALAIDIMLPAFPQMTGHFALADSNTVQFVLLSYLLGFGVAQPIYGPLSDRYGRLAPLYAGLALYIAGAVVGAFAPDFNTLLLVRFLQGVGAASTRVISLAAVRDTHSGRAMASTMSMVFVVFMAIPVLAPALGQLIILFGEWREIFIAMGLVAFALMIWCLARLPETLPPERRRPLTAASVIAGFGLVLANRHAFLYGLAMTSFFGGLFGFINLAQPVYVDVYGLGPYFPIAFAAVAVLMAVTSFINSRLVLNFGMRRLAHSALAGFAALSATMTALAALDALPFFAFMALLCCMMPLFGFVGSNLNAIAMEPLGAVAGTASAVFGFMQTAGGALIGSVSQGGDPGRG
nr:multidrug effflux MFS transporter [Rhizobiaceae bacterium]